MTDYTLIISSQYVRMDRSSARNVIVPLNSSVAFPIGHTIKIRQVGDGKITVIGVPGVTLNSPFTATTAFKGAVIELIKIGTNTWDVSGDMNVTTMTGFTLLSENVGTSESIVFDLVVSGNRILMEDGTSFLLLEDGISKINLEA